MNAAVTEPESPAPAVEWRVNDPPVPVEPSRHAVYRGMALSVDQYSLTVTGLFRGYTAIVTRGWYGSGDRPSIEERMAMAVAIADELLANGWEAR